MILVLSYQSFKREEEEKEMLWGCDRCAGKWASFVQTAQTASWPHLVPETFITSLELEDDLEIFTGFSYAIFAHLYLLLALLDNIWYFEKNFGTEIKNINVLVAGRDSLERSEVIAWPMKVLVTLQTQ